MVREVCAFTGRNFSCGESTVSTGADKMWWWCGVGVQMWWCGVGVQTWWCGAGVPNRELVLVGGVSGVISGTGSCLVHLLMLLLWCVLLLSAPCSCLGRLSCILCESGQVQRLCVSSQPQERSLGDRLLHRPL